jgi:hypothetical protein
VIIVKESKKLRIEKLEKLNIRAMKKRYLKEKNRRKNQFICLWIDFLIGEREMKGFC